MVDGIESSGTHEMESHCGAREWARPNLENGPVLERHSIVQATQVSGLPLECLPQVSIIECSAPVL